MSSLDPTVRLALEAAIAKQAEEVVALDVRDICAFTQTLVICQGTSNRHVQTITEAVARKLREHGVRPHHLEGEAAADWVLMDYMSFVVHVFQEKTRRFYALEHLWGDAPRLNLDDLLEAESAPTTTPGARMGE